MRADGNQSREGSRRRVGRCSGALAQESTSVSPVSSRSDFRFHLHGWFSSREVRMKSWDDYERDQRNGRYVGRLEAVVCLLLFALALSLGLPAISKSRDADSKRCYDVGG